MNTDTKDITAQSMPTGTGEKVIDHVIADLVLRAETGRKKYGTYLRTHNGRSADIDLYKELLDAVMYQKQKMMEGRESEMTAAEIIASIDDDIAFSERMNEILTIRAKRKAQVEKIYFYDGAVMRVTCWTDDQHLFCRAVNEYEPGEEMLYSREFVEQNKINIFES